MNPPAAVSTDEETITIFCPDCRGRFDAPGDCISEGEIIDCDLCGAEIEVVSENPIKVRKYTEDYDF